ncbi:hypothetical protein [Fibrella arboris]|uniref:hypothetical protein n=1 Tax=Fibrella arboris TaxID=3242486 RepID=UPI003521A973
MKTTTLNIRYLVYGLCLVASLYNCKTKDVDSLTPFTYTFKGFDTKLPDVTPTQPAAVSATAGSVTSSTAAAAVTSGLSSLSAGGPVPAAVSNAAAAVSNAVSPEKAASLAASFTPDLMKSLAAGGTLPASLKAESEALAANPALKAYLPSFTLPTVNGKAIGGRTGVGTPGNVIGAVAAAFLRADDDACKAAAIAAYNTAVQNLTTTRDAQLAAVNAVFTQAQAAANAEVTPCKANISGLYTTARTNATNQYNAGIAALDAGKAALGQTLYNALHVLYDVGYAQALAGIAALETAQGGACDAVNVAKQAAATSARDGDLAKVNGNFNTAKATLDKNLATATASCHNQGNGG